MPIFHTGRANKRGGHIRLTTPGITDIKSTLGASIVATNTAATVTPASNWYINLGMGNVVFLTPLYTSRVFFSVSGIWTAPTGAGNTSLLTVEYGTGTAPVNGFDPGGAISNNYGGYGYDFLGDTAVNNPLELSGLITGLTPGTAYWFDVAVTSSVPTGPIGLNFWTFTVIEI